MQTKDVHEILRTHQIEAIQRKPRTSIHIWLALNWHMNCVTPKKYRLDYQSRLHQNHGIDPQRERQAADIYGCSRC